MVNTGFKKVICTAVTIAFVVTSIFSPGNLSAQPIQTSLPLMNIDVTKIIVNSGVAFLEERFTSPEGPKGRTVIAIQNAHGIYDAQENIRALIQELQDKYNFNLVGLEGGAGKSDHTFLRTFPDKEVNRKVAESYMRRAELSGGEAAAILNPKPGIFYGVETPELYYINRNSFLKAQGLKDANLHAINLFEKKLDKQREKIFPFELLEFHKAEQKYLSGKMPLWEFINILGGYNLSEQYPGVLAIYAAIAKARQAGRKAEEARQAEEAAAKVEGRVLFEEIKNLSADIKDNLSFRRRPESRGIQELLAQYHELRILRNLVSLEMTRAEYEECLKLDSGLRRNDNLKDLNLTPALQFYADAVKRDHAMYDNLIRDMKKENQKISIIVAGGFHTSGFAERLKKDGISFAVYSPRIHEMPKENKYLDVMGGKVSYVSTVESPLPTMGLNPDGEKFVENYSKTAVREEVASGKSLSELERNWRDDIIRAVKAKSALADPSSMIRRLEKIFRSFLTRASQILTELKKNYLSIAGAEAKKKVDTFVASERKRLQIAKPVEALPASAASLGRTSIPILDEIADVPAQRWVSKELLRAVEEKYQSGRVEIVHVAGTTEELSNPASISSLEKALRGIPDEKPVLLVLHHYSSDSDVMDTTVLIGKADELKQKEARGSILKNHIFMGEYDYVFSLRIYPSLPKTGVPFAYLESVSIGRNGSDPLRNKKYMSAVIENTFSILEEQYPGMRIAADVQNFIVANWFNDYFSAHVALDEKAEGIEAAVMSHDAEWYRTKMGDNANPSDSSDLNYYLDQLSKKFGEHADDYYQGLSLLGTIGKRRGPENRRDIVDRAVNAFLDSFKKENLPRVISFEMEKTSKSPRRVAGEAKSWLVQMKKKNKKGESVFYGSIYFDIPRDEQSATLVLSLPGQTSVSREIPFSDPEAAERIREEISRFMDRIVKQIKKEAAGEQLNLFPEPALPALVTAHSLGAGEESAALIPEGFWEDPALRKMFHEKMLPEDEIKYQLSKRGVAVTPDIESVLSKIHFYQAGEESELKSFHIDVLAALLSRDPKTQQYRILQVLKKKGIPLKSVKSIAIQNISLLDQVDIGRGKGSARDVARVMIQRNGQMIDLAAAVDRIEEEEPEEQEPLEKSPSYIEYQTLSAAGAVKEMVPEPYLFAEIGKQPRAIRVVFKEFVPGIDLEDWFDLISRHGRIIPSKLTREVMYLVGRMFGEYYQRAGGWPKDMHFGNIIIRQDSSGKIRFRIADFTGHDTQSRKITLDLDGLISNHVPRSLAKLLLSDAEIENHTHYLLKGFESTYARPEQAAAFFKALEPDLAVIGRANTRNILKNYSVMRDIIKIDSGWDHKPVEAAGASLGTRQALLDDIAAMTKVWPYLSEEDEGKFSEFFRLIAAKREYRDALRGLNVLSLGSGGIRGAEETLLAAGIGKLNSVGRIRQGGLYKERTYLEENIGALVPRENYSHEDITYGDYLTRLNQKNPGSVDLAFTFSGLEPVSVPEALLADGVKPERVLIETYRQLYSALAPGGVILNFGYDPEQILAPGVKAEVKKMGYEIQTSGTGNRVIILRKPEAARAASLGAKRPADLETSRKLAAAVMEALRDPEQKIQAQSIFRPAGKEKVGRKWFDVLELDSKWFMIAKMNAEGKPEGMITHLALNNHGEAYVMQIESKYIGTQKKGRNELINPQSNAELLLPVLDALEQKIAEGKIIKSEDFEWEGRPLDEFLREFRAKTSPVIGRSLGAINAIAAKLAGVNPDVWIDEVAWNRLRKANGENEIHLVKILGTESEVKENLERELKASPKDQITVAILDIVYDKLQVVEYLVVADRAEILLKNLNNIVKWGPPSGSYSYLLHLSAYPPIMEELNPNFNLHAVHFGREMEFNLAESVDVIFRTFNSVSAGLAKEFSGFSLTGIPPTRLMAGWDDMTALRPDLGFRAEPLTISNYPDHLMLEFHDPALSDDDFERSKLFQISLRTDEREPGTVLLGEGKMSLFKSSSIDKADVKARLNSWFRNQVFPWLKSRKFNRVIVLPFEEKSRAYFSSLGFKKDDRSGFWVLDLTARGASLGARPGREEVPEEEVYGLMPEDYWKDPAFRNLFFEKQLEGSVLVNELEKRGVQINPEIRSLLDKIRFYQVGEDSKLAPYQLDVLAALLTKSPKTNEYRIFTVLAKKGISPEKVKAINLQSINLLTQVDVGRSKGQNRDVVRVMVETKEGEPFDFAAAVDRTRVKETLYVKLRSRFDKFFGMKNLATFQEYEALKRDGGKTDLLPKPYLLVRSGDALILFKEYVPGIDLEDWFDRIRRNIVKNKKSVPPRMIEEIMFRIGRLFGEYYLKTRQWPDDMHFGNIIIHTGKNKKPNLRIADYTGGVKEFMDIAFRFEQLVELSARGALFQFEESDFPTEDPRFLMYLLAGFESAFSKQDDVLTFFIRIMPDMNRAPDTYAKRMLDRFLLRGDRIQIDPYWGTEPVGGASLGLPDRQAGEISDARKRELQHVIDDLTVRLATMVPIKIQKFEITEGDILDQLQSLRVERNVKHSVTSLNQIDMEIVDAFHKSGLTDKKYTDQEAEYVATMAAQNFRGRSLGEGASAEISQAPEWVRAGFRNLFQEAVGSGAVKLDSSSFGKFKTLIERENGRNKNVLSTMNTLVLGSGSYPISEEILLEAGAAKVVSVGMRRQSSRYAEDQDFNIWKQQYKPDPKRFENVDETYEKYLAAVPDGSIDLVITHGGLEKAGIPNELMLRAPPKTRVQYLKEIYELLYQKLSPGAIIINYGYGGVPADDNSGDDKIIPDALRPDLPAMGYEIRVTDKNLTAVLRKPEARAEKPAVSGASLGEDPLLEIYWDDLAAAPRPFAGMNVEVMVRQAAEKSGESAALARWAVLQKSAEEWQYDPNKISNEEISVLMLGFKLLIHDAEGGDFSTGDVFQMARARIMTRTYVRSFFGDAPQTAEILRQAKSHFLNSRPYFDYIEHQDELKREQAITSLLLQAYVFLKLASKNRDVVMAAEVRDELIKITAEELKEFPSRVSRRYLELSELMETLGLTLPLKAIAQSKVIPSIKDAKTGQPAAKASSLGILPSPREMVRKFDVEDWIAPGLMQELARMNGNQPPKVIQAAGEYKNLTGRPPRELAEVADEEMVVLILHVKHADPGRLDETVIVDRMDHTVIADRAGRIKKNYETILKNDIGLEEYEYEFQMHAYVSRNPAVRPLLFVDYISVGRHQDKNSQLRGKKYGEQSFDRVVSSVIEKVYPQWDVATNAMHEKVARWFAEYFSARIPESWEVSGRIQPYTYVPLNQITTPMKPYLNPKNPYDLVFYLSKIQAGAKTLKERQKIYHQVALVGKVGDRLSGEQLRMLEEKSETSARGASLGVAEDKGLCVTGDTELPIIRGGVGARGLSPVQIPITEVRPGDQVLSLNESTQQIEPHRINGLLDMGVKPVFKLTTASGRSIKTTANHPYLVMRNGKSEWVKVSEIQVGEKIAVTKTNENVYVSYGRVYPETTKQIQSTEPTAKKASLSWQLFSFFWKQYQAYSKDKRKTSADQEAQPERERAEKVAGQTYGENSLGQICNEPCKEFFSMISKFHNGKDNITKFNNNQQKYNNNEISLFKNAYAEIAGEPSPYPLPSKGRGNSGNSDTLGNSLALAKQRERADAERRVRVNDILWDPIISIEPIGREHVYDIEVDGTHNFIGNGIFAHNTYIQTVPSSTTGPDAVRGASLGTVEVLTQILKSAPALETRKELGKVIRYDSAVWNLSVEQKESLAAEIAEIDSAAFSSLGRSSDRLLEMLELPDKNQYLLVDDAGRITGYLLSGDRLAVRRDDGIKGRGTFLVDVWMNEEARKFAAGSGELKISWISANDSVLFYHRYLVRKGMDYETRNNFDFIAYPETAGQLTAEQKAVQEKYLRDFEARYDLIQKTLAGLEQGKQYALNHDLYGSPSQMPFTAPPIPNTKSFIMTNLLYHNAATLSRLNADGAREIVIPASAIPDKQRVTSPVAAASLGGGIFYRPEISSNVMLFSVSLSPKRFMASRISMPANLPLAS